MITAHFVRDEAVKIELPSADSATKTGNKKTVEVLIDSKGRVFLNGAGCHLDLLEEKLKTALSGTAQKVVTLKGDRDSNLGITVTALDAARKAGAESVDIVTESK